MKLYIDTTSSKTIKVGLEERKKTYVKEEFHDKKKAQIVLPLIDEILHERHVDIKDITEIEVNPGPGSFTGIRVGLAVANTLSKVLQIPINGKTPGTIIEAKYE